MQSIRRQTRNSSAATVSIQALIDYGGRRNPFGDHRPAECGQYQIVVKVRRERDVGRTIQHAVPTRDECRIAVQVPDAVIPTVRVHSAGYHRFSEGRLSMTNQDFDNDFNRLTGHRPFPWQVALYDRFIEDQEDNIPNVAELPTGMGKTNVIAVWLLALMARPKRTPRRLVYVVNRRTVVDQTTVEVLRLRENLPELNHKIINRLTVSTLRGQFADNQEWSADPSRPAVICGTVDMIGSRLLFEGYRIGFKSRPLHAGFLGQDTLLVHDEAHLESAFQKLIETIQCEQGNCLPGTDGVCVRCKRKGRPRDLRPLHVMALSATARGDAENAKTEDHKPFGLTDEEKEPPNTIPNPPTEPIHHVWRRLKAKKSLRVHAVDDEKKLAEKVAELALTHKDSNAAMLIFVRTIDDVNNVCDKLTDKENGVPADQVRQLTGTMRGYERDGLVCNPAFIRFLPDADRPEDVTPAEGTVYLVCTSAGEVGVNLSADHMVCDLSTFDSMAQRLGRVNRLGDRDDTRVDVVHPESYGKVDKKTGELKADELDKRRATTFDLIRKLDELGKDEDGTLIYDASPKALGDLPANQRLTAFAPEPTILPATEILFDAWALTTIRDKMPGRPPVAPYLHGVADKIQQTTVVWRAELDLIDPESPDAEKAMQAILTKHRIRPHETLTTNSYRVAEFFKMLKERIDLHDILVALQFSRNLRLTTVGQLIDDSGPLNAEPTLVLPASFSGLDEKGSLSADAVRQKDKPTAVGSEVVDSDEDQRTEDDKEPCTIDIADHDGYEPYDAKNVRPRIRVLIVRSEDGWSVRAMPGGKPLPEDWKFEQTFETSTKLVNAIRKQSGLNVRLVQAIEQNEEGEDIRALVCLSPAPPTQDKKEDQLLTKHVKLVEQEAQRLADPKALKLQEPYRSALLFAAKWHDEGKNVPVWQRYIGGPDDNGEPLGKSAKWRNPKLLAGYRHEFGSLLRIPDSEAERFFADPQLKLTTEQQADARDLALHMIATHHGHGRPHFKQTVVDGCNSEQEEATHLEVMRRYARLQRKYGRWGLAYLESLLRAADAAASRAVGLDPESDDDAPEEGDE